MRGCQSIALILHDIIYEYYLTIFIIIHKINELAQDLARIRIQQANGMKAMYDAISNMLVAGINELFPSLEGTSNNATIEALVDKKPNPVVPLPILNEDEDELVFDPINFLDEKFICNICMNNQKEICFNCGHLTCVDCCKDLIECPFCKGKITIKIKMYAS